MKCEEKVQNELSNGSKSPVKERSFAEGSRTHLSIVLELHQKTHHNKDGRRCIQLDQIMHINSKDLDDGICVRVLRTQGERTAI